MHNCTLPELTSELCKLSFFKKNHVFLHKICKSKESLKISRYDSPIYASVYVSVCIQVVCNSKNSSQSASNSVKRQRSFDLLCIAMETLVICCDVLNSFGQHCHERGSVRVSALVALFHSWQQRETETEIFVYDFFVWFFFILNAFESKRQDGLLESFCVRLYVCYVTVELRDNCNCCTLRSKFEIDHKKRKKRFKCQHTCT